MADRYNHRVGNDDFFQPRALFTCFDAGQKKRLFKYRRGDGGVRTSLSGVSSRCSTRYTRTMARACAALKGRGAAEAADSAKKAASRCKPGAPARYIADIDLPIGAGRLL